MEITVNDVKWPLITVIIIRQSWERGQLMQQSQIQYDLAYGKAEEMAHNHLRPMLEELIKRHKR